MIIGIHKVLHMQSIKFLCTSLANKKLKISNDQELTQSEPRSSPRNQNGKQPKLQIDMGRRTGLVVRASDSGSGDPGSILGRVGVFVSLSKRHLLPKSTGNTQE